MSSTVQAVHDEMMELGCNPVVVTDVCREMAKQPYTYQIIFRSRLEGMEIAEIARNVGMWRETISRIIHNKLSCIASLMDSTDVT